MVRQCADESVPAAEHGIEEVIIRHRQTRRGIRTTEKVVPVLIPEKQKPGQSSCSKKGQKGHVDLDLAERSGVPDTTMDEPQAPQYIDEQADDAYYRDAAEGVPKKSNACITYISYEAN